tara:strand:- start:219 stop:965 length:747 start_codon:yes stop_codon:yes gene_type:complete
MPLVSVVVTYFKKKKYILRCLKSISAQTFRNFEIILVYDDNDKEEFQYIKDLKKKFKNLIVYKNKKNLGAGESKNIGVKISKGKYIAFLDSDDKWHRNKLKIQINYMLKNSIDISHTSYKIIDDSGKTLGLRIAETLNYEMLLKSCDIGLSSVIIKKNIFNNKVKFANIKTKEDYVLWLKITEKGKKIYGLNKILLSWNKSENSLSSSLFRKLIDGFIVYKRYRKYNFLKSIFFLIILSLNFLKKKYL